jgi:hypothetical protein
LHSRARSSLSARCRLILDLYGFNLIKCQAGRFVNRLPLESLPGMSAIASFYLVRKEEVARLKDLAARPVGPVTGKKWRDPYFEFVSTNARELETYEWSGYVIGSEVFFFLQSRSVTWEEYCEKELSDYLSQARDSSIMVFRADAGQQLARLIERNWPDETSLVAFLNSQDMASAAGESIPIEAVFDGLRILKSWLSQIDESHIGLLTIG